MSDAKPEQAPKKKTDVMTLIVLAFSGLNLAAMGVGGFLTFKGTLGWQAPMIQEQALAAAANQEIDYSDLKDPLIYTMDKFTVNLAQDPSRMIRVEINVEMLSADGFEEIINADNQAKVRDHVIEILNGKNLSEIESLQGKLFLKDEIAQLINKTLDRGVVKDVFFSEFVVQ